jgi:putative methionine-R-sulfoxide reductase with GAF domain
MYRAKLGETPYRDYGNLVSPLKPGADRESTMRLIADACWETLGQRGISWIGFYLKIPGRDEMALGPSRDKPACSPIGLHGACGRCWQERRPIIVADVTTLGANYIACDPKDRSELVIPLLEPDGSCWGVLDADSYDPGAFSETDLTGLTRAVERVGLSTPQSPPLLPLRL